jgi:hypothetical protein
VVINSKIMLTIPGTDNDTQALTMLTAGQQFPGSGRYFFGVPTDHGSIHYKMFEVGERAGV